MANDKLAVIQADETVRELKEIVTVNNEAIKSFNDLLNVTNKINKGFTSGKPKEYAESVEKLRKTQERAEKATERERLAQIRLQKAREKAIDQFTKEESKRARVTKRVKQQNDAYGRLNKTQQEAARRSQRLGAILLELERRGQTNTKRFLELSKAYERATVKAKGLDTELKKLDSSVGRNNRNVGNYKSALGGLQGTFKNLAGAFGVASAIDLFARLTTEMFNQTRQLDSLNNALLAIFETEAEVAKQNEFLIDLADRYGLNLLKLTETYKSFSGAVKGTSLEGEKARKIFDTVSKTSAVLGLSAEQTAGALTALEQMISKGNVSAEELRGQLGERIPGAFNIFARAIGVSTSELNSMLQKGEVLADETLPLFAEELERAFNLDKVDRVSTLNSSINRMNNTLTLSVKGLSETADSSSVLISLIETLTEQINELLEGLSDVLEIGGNMNDIFKTWTELLNTLGIEVEGAISLFDLLKVSMVLITKPIELVIDLVNKLAKLINKLLVSAKGYIEESPRLKKALELILKPLSDMVDGYNSITKSISEMDEVNKKSMKSMKREITSTLNLFNQLSSQVFPQQFEGIEAPETNLPFDFSGTIDNRPLKILEAEAKARKEAEKQREKAAKDAEKSRKKVEQERLRALKEERKEDKKIRQEELKDQESLNDTVAKSQEGANNQLEQYNVLRGIANKRMQDAIKLSQEQVSEQAGTPMVDQEGDEELAKLQGLLGLRDTISEGFTDLGLDMVADEFSNFFDTVLDDAANFQEKLASGLAVIGTFSASLLDKSEERIASLDKENEAFQESADKKIESIEKQLEAENLSVEEKEQLEAQLEVFEQQKEEKERATKTQQFKAQQQADAQQAIINGALGATKSIAQLGFIKGLPAALASIAFAAVQSSLILSKSVPEFYKGTQNAPEGAALTQERGAEIITDKKGNIKTLGSDRGAQLMNLEKGDKVYTASQSKKMIDQMMFGNDIINSMVLNGMVLPSVIVENKGVTKEEMLQVMEGVKSEIRRNAPTAVANTGNKIYTKKGNKGWEESILKPDNKNNSYKSNKKN